jgi:hypothetical protein
MRAAQSTPLRYIHAAFPVGHFLISLFFVACAVALMGLAGSQFWSAITSGAMGSRDQLGTVLESLALSTVALSALELAETIIEEQVQREAHMGAPTRVRRFLSRFMVVLVVALSIETLLLVIKISHEDLRDLEYAAMLAIGVGALLAGWGVFVRLNRTVEELEPEAMHEAKEEDRKLRR